jgi:hypothetical protein
MATMAKHDVSGILVNQGSACDVIYEEKFTEFGAEKEGLMSRIKW